MNQENQEPEYQNNIFGIFIGLVVGTLAGAATMLLLAPQSGKDTRIQLQKKGTEIYDRTSGIVGEAMAKVRTDTNKITMNGRQKAKELMQQGQDLVVEQLERVSDAALAGKKAVQNS